MSADRDASRGQSLPMSLRTGETGGHRLQLELKPRIALHHISRVVQAASKSSDISNVVHYKNDGGKYDASDTTVKLCSGAQYIVSLTSIPPVTVRACGWSAGDDAADGASIQPLVPAQAPTPAGATMQPALNKATAASAPPPPAAAAPPSGTAQASPQEDLLIDLSDPVPSTASIEMPPSPFLAPAESVLGPLPSKAQVPWSMDPATHTVQLESPGNSSLNASGINPWGSSAFGQASINNVPTASSGVIHTYSVHFSSAGPSAAVPRSDPPSVIMNSHSPIPNTFSDNAFVTAAPPAAGEVANPFHPAAAGTAQADQAGAAPANPFVAPAAVSAVNQPAANPFYATSVTAPAAAPSNPFLPATAAPALHTSISAAGNNPFSVNPAHLAGTAASLYTNGYATVSTTAQTMPGTKMLQAPVQHPTDAASNPFVGQTAGSAQPAANLYSSTQPAPVAQQLAASNPFAPSLLSAAVQPAQTSNPFSVSTSVSPATANPFSATTPAPTQPAVLPGHQQSDMASVEGKLAATTIEPLHPVTPQLHHVAAGSEPASSAAGVMLNGDGLGGAREGARQQQQEASADVLPSNLSEGISPRAHKPTVPAAFAEQLAASTRHIGPLGSSQQTAQQQDSWNWSCMLPPSRKSDRAQLYLHLDTQELGQVVLPLLIKVYKPTDKAHANGQRLRYMQYNVAPDSVTAGQARVVSSAVFGLP